MWRRPWLRGRGCALVVPGPSQRPGGGAGDLFGATARGGRSERPSRAPGGAALAKLRPRSSRPRRATVVLTWTGPGKRGTVLVRAVLSGPHHAASAPSTLRVLAPRPGSHPVKVSPRAEVLDPSVVSLVPAPGRAGTLRYAGGNLVKAGDIIAIGHGPATPDGFLGRATRSAIRNGQVVVSTVPATLLEAVPSGSIKECDAKRALGLGGESFARGARPRRSRCYHLQAHRQGINQARSVLRRGPHVHGGLEAHRRATERESYGRRPRKRLDHRNGQRKRIVHRGQDPGGLAARRRSTRSSARSRSS